jgi:hypothetical protein
MSTNTADDIRIKLKKAIKDGKTDLGAIASNLGKFMDEALWEYLDLPGESPADKLHSFVTLSFDHGGLNCKIDEMDVLLGLNAPVQRQFRGLVFAAKQGERNDLKEEPKVDAKLSPKKPKGLSDSNKASERAANRAAKAVPALDKLLNNQLVSKRNAAKVGQTIKDPENPTEKELEIMAQREQLEQELARIVPEPLPEEPQERKKLQKQVQQAIEQTTGKVSTPKVSLGEDPQKTAEAIVKAKSDIDYLQQLVVAIELEIETLQPSLVRAA